MAHECQIISIFNRRILGECINRLQRRYNLEDKPSRKKAIQKRIDLFSKRLAEVEAILGKSRLKLR